MGKLSAISLQTAENEGGDAANENAAPPSEAAENRETSLSAVVTLHTILEGGGLLDTWQNFVQSLVKHLESQAAFNVEGELESNGVNQQMEMAMHALGLQRLQNEINGGNWSKVRHSTLLMLCAFTCKKLLHPPTPTNPSLPPSLAPSSRNFQTKTTSFSLTRLTTMTTMKTRTTTKTRMNTYRKCAERHSHRLRLAVTRQHPHPRQQRGRAGLMPVSTPISTPTLPTSTQAPLWLCLLQRQRATLQTLAALRPNLHLPGLIHSQPHHSQLLSTTLLIAEEWTFSRSWRRATKCCNRQKDLSNSFSSVCHRVNKS